MPAEPGIAEPWTETRGMPHLDEDEVTNDDGPYVVILYNDEYHAVDEVVSQIQKATGYELERCVGIMLEAHTRGRSRFASGSFRAFIAASICLATLG